MKLMYRWPKWLGLVYGTLVWIIIISGIVWLVAWLIGK
jgi:hypothetical protein